MEYRVIAATKLDVLESLVEAALADGWVLQGGLSVMPTAAPYHNYGCYQAVTRDSPLHAILAEIGLSPVPRRQAAVA